MKMISRLFPQLLLGGLLAACTATSTQQPVDATADTPRNAVAESGPASDAGTSNTTPGQNPVAQEEVIEYGNFTEEQLYQAIISELGAQRGDLGEAGNNYLDLAIQTRDLGIIQRAVQFASVNNDVNALMQLGLLWADVDPTAARPHLLLSFQFLETGNFQQALSHMARVIELGGEIDFSALAARTGQLDNRTRSRLIENLRPLVNEFADQVSVRIALVQLLAQNGEFDAALAEFQALEDQSQANPRMVMLHSQILQRAGDEEGSLRVMREGVALFTEDKTLRLSFARMLIQLGDYRAAQQQFAYLMEQDPQDWETLYSMALLDMEMESFRSAAQRFLRLVNIEERADESNYYLGFIYVQLDDPEQAIEHYRRVRIGTQNFLAAQQQATFLSIEIGKLEEAHAHLNRLSRGQPRLEILFNTVESSALIQAGMPDKAQELLDRALNKYPNETDLLFARVLLSDSLGNQESSEQDLRQIILMKPDDARSLNHLGYMLANQTDRYEEALQLLERAIEISPDDPAIIDSLGWAQYKLGRYDEALANLRRAYAAFPDHEVASHVGEVLWMMGRQDEAIEIWREALETRPDSELILEAVDRLQADI